MDSRSAAPSSSGEYRSGVLRLDIEPASARVQLFVDGLFVGSPTDFDNEISLEAGSHAIELRADGYESIAFNARIVAAQAITYRGTLRALAKAESAAGSSDRAPNPAAATPKRSGPDTFYFIPGCYMGNVPPEQVVLPASCDKSKLVTRTR
jgi:hypothetical protein